MKRRKFKKWWLTIPPLLTKRTTLYNLTSFITPRHIALEIHTGPNLIKIKCELIVA